MMEDSSSDDDLIDLPGPSTRARVKRKEWPDPDDRGGTSSKKVGGGSSRTPQDKNSQEMNKEEKKKEAARLRQAKSRAKKSEAEKKEVKRPMAGNLANLAPKPSPPITKSHFFFVSAECSVCGNAE